MSKPDKTDKGDDNKTENRSTGEAARRILLAGIGAYGRAFMEAQEALKDVRGKSSDVFDELVQKGEMMEMAFEHKSKQVTDQVTKQVREKTTIPNLHIDERIKKMRARLTGSAKGAFSHGQDEQGAADLSGRIDALEAKLDKILSILEPKKSPPKKTRAKRSGTKTSKTTTVRTAKKPSAKTSKA